MQLAVRLALCVAKAFENVVQLGLVGPDFSPRLLAALRGSALGHFLPRLVRLVVQRQRLLLLVQERLHKAVLLLQLLFASVSRLDIVTVLSQSRKEGLEFLCGREILLVCAKAVLTFLSRFLRRKRMI